MVYVAKNWKREYEDSLSNPEKYFGEVARKALYWKREWKEYFRFEEPIHKYFVGGLTNYTYWLDILDRSVLRERYAYIWEGETVKDGKAQEVKMITYHELFQRVNMLSKALKDLGVRKGSRVAIYICQLSLRLSFPLLQFTGLGQYSVQYLAGSLVMR